MSLTTVTKCLACGSSNIHLSLDLGNQPLANSYIVNTDETEYRYPLAVNLCHDCFHLQLSHIVDPAIIYKNYLYATGTNKTIKEYSDWFAGYVNETCHTLTRRVLDIGCNDGTQLNYFKQRGFVTYGIDPATNLFSSSSQNHNIICDFFGPSVAANIDVRFDAIVAQNVFAHNPNPLEFLQTCKSLMSGHTKLYIQTSQADMVLNNEFDTIYHEHINFFNINSMNELASRAELNLIDVIKTPIHGNSYIFILSDTINSPFTISNLIEMESNLTKQQTYLDWEDNVKSNMAELKKTISNFKERGYKIVGYGAAAKGNTLLNYIDEPLDLIIDDSTLKQNMYTPGTNSPIKSIDALKEFDKDDKFVFMPLAWNFFTEISQRIKSVHNEPTDLFLKYFPHVSVMGGNDV
jgi:SAM-dependent methyltransferase